MSDWKNPVAGGEPRSAQISAEVPAGEGHSYKNSGSPSTTSRPSDSKRSPLVPQVKDTILLLGWITGIVLIAALCWFFTGSARNNLFIKSINRVLEETGDPHRLGEPVNPGFSGSFGTGAWYTIKANEKFPDGTKAYVFTFFGEGVFFPCMAIVNTAGKAEEFIPLSSHGKRMIRQISPGIIKIFMQRLEGDKS